MPKNCSNVLLSECVSLCVLLIMYVWINALFLLRVIM